MQHVCVCKSTTFFLGSWGFGAAFFADPFEAGAFVGPSAALAGSFLVPKSWVPTGFSTFIDAIAIKKLFELKRRESLGLND